jgi:hypothetical protein
VNAGSSRALAMSATWRFSCGVWFVLMGMGGRAFGQNPQAPQEQKQQCLAAYADAQELRQAGELLAARERLLVCTKTGCPALTLKDCAGWLTEVDNSLSSAVFAVSDASGHDITDARVTTSGRTVSERTDGRAVMLDPGPHTFTIEAEGYESAESSVSLRESEKNRILRIQLNAAPSPVAPVAPEIAAPARAAATSCNRFPLGHCQLLATLARTDDRARRCRARERGQLRLLWNIRKKRTTRGGPLRRRLRALHHYRTTQLCDRRRQLGSRDRRRGIGGCSVLVGRIEARQERRSRTAGPPLTAADSSRFLTIRTLARSNRTCA